MPDSDLAELHRVETKVLSQAVTRNYGPSFSISFCRRLDFPFEHS